MARIHLDGVVFSTFLQYSDLAMTSPTRVLEWLEPFWYMGRSGVMCSNAEGGVVVIREAEAL